MTGPRPNLGEIKKPDEKDFEQSVSMVQQSVAQLHRYAALKDDARYLPKTSYEEKGTDPAKKPVSRLKQAVEEIGNLGVDKDVCDNLDKCFESHFNKWMKGEKFDRAVWDHEIKKELDKIDNTKDVIKKETADLKSEVEKMQAEVKKTDEELSKANKDLQQAIEDAKKAEIKSGNEVKFNPDLEKKVEDLKKLVDETKQQNDSAKEALSEKQKAYETKKADEDKLETKKTDNIKKIINDKLLEEMQRLKNSLSNQRFCAYSQMKGAELRGSRNALKERVEGELVDLPKPKDDQAGFGIAAGPYAEPIKDGWYEYIGSSSRFHIENGIVRPVPPPTSMAEYEKAYGDVIDILVEARGATAIKIDYQRDPHSGDIKFSLEHVTKLVEIAEKKGIPVKLGDGALKGLYQERPGYWDKFTAWRKGETADPASKLLNRIAALNTRLKSNDLRKISETNQNDLDNEIKKLQEWSSTRPEVAKKSTLDTYVDGFVKDVHKKEEAIKTLDETIQSLRAIEKSFQDLKTDAQGKLQADAKSSLPQPLQDIESKITETQEKIAKAEKEKAELAAAVKKDLETARVSDSKDLNVPDKMEALRQQKLKDLLESDVKQQPDDHIKFEEGRLKDLQIALNKLEARQISLMTDLEENRENKIVLDESYVHENSKIDTLRKEIQTQLEDLKKRAEFLQKVEPDKAKNLVGALDKFEKTELPGKLNKEEALKKQMEEVQKAQKEAEAKAKTEPEAKRKTTP